MIAVAKSNLAAKEAEAREHRSLFFQADAKDAEAAGAAGAPRIDRQDSAEERVYIRID